MRRQFVGFITCLVFLSSLATRVIAEGRGHPDEDATVGKLRTAFASASKVVSIEPLLGQWSCIQFSARRGSTETHPVELTIKNIINNLFLVHGNSGYFRGGGFRFDDNGFYHAGDDSFDEGRLVPDQSRLIFESSFFLEPSDEVRYARPIGFPGGKVGSYMECKRSS